MHWRFHPIPNTSIRTTPLRKSRENSSSFPSIATLKLFRKKPPPPQPSSLVEPYEVAPGIWSTDATARVFGYLDTNDKGAELRAQSAGLDIQTPGQKAKRKPVPVRDSLGRCKQARFVDGTKQCNTDRIRDESDTTIQSRLTERVEKGIKTESDWIGVKQERMRTVSRDDQLVERGANPRTGLVSPFVVNDNSEDCLGGDYIAVDEAGSAGPSLGRRTRSGKWKQDSLGWSLVESPLLGPIAQSMSDKVSRTVSTKQLEDRLLVERPGMDEPDPRNMTNEQIRKYQEGIAREYKRGGGNIAMLNPDTLPSPQQWTPEGPSTPLTKLRQIRRKEVGSSMVRKRTSCDTAIIDANNGAPALSTQRKDIGERQKVRIITPSNTPKGSSFEPCANVSNAMGTTDPFLGRGSRRARSQTLSATQSKSYLNTWQAHQSHQNESESSPSSPISDSLAASQTLSQYLPHLEFLHTSHFANLETSSYHRPTQLRRLLGQQTRAVEDACTTTFTTTSTKKQRWKQSAQMHRQGGNDVVPRVNYLSSEYEKPLGGYLQASTPRNEQFHPNDIAVDILRTSGSVIGKSPALGPTEKVTPVEPLVKTRYQRKPHLPAECLRQPPYKNQPMYLARPTHTTQRPSLGGAKVARQRIQRKQSGDWCTPTYDHPGNGAVPGGRMECICDDKEQAKLPAELTIGGDSRAWFTGQWAEVPEEGEGADLPTSMQEETFTRRQLVLTKATGVNLWLDEPLTKLRPIRKLLCRMMCHFRRTLHHTSLALNTLRMANATSRDHLRAMKDLVLAALHLLVLLKSLMILRGLLVFVCKVLYCVWHPIQATLRIVGWCVMG